jgi:hypothetical protein
MGFLRALQRASNRVLPEHIFTVNKIVAVEDSIQEVYDRLGDRVPDACYRQRWSTDEDRDALVRGGQTAEEVAAYYDHAGARAVITCLGDEIVGYAWLMTGNWTSHGWLRVRLAADEVWGGYIYTAPEHRGRRILAGVRQFAYPLLIEEGYDKVLVFVDALNNSSLRAGGTPGRNYVGSIFYFRLLGLVVYRVGTKWGAGFWNRRRPYKFSYDVFDRTGPSRPPRALGR